MRTAMANEVLTFNSLPSPSGIEGTAANYHKGVLRRRRREDMTSATDGPYEKVDRMN